MRRLLLSLLLGAVLASFGRVQNIDPSPAPSLKGSWTGALIVGPEVLRCHIHLYEEGGVWKAAVDLPEQGVFDVAYEVRVEENAIRLWRVNARTGVEVVYEGRLDGKTLAGVYCYQQGGQRVEGVFQAVQQSLLLNRFQPLPSFDLLLLDGRRVQNSHYRGRYLLVDLWMTRCKICIPKRPVLEAAAARYKGGALAVLSIALDSAAAVAAYRKENYPMDWDHAVLEGGWQHPLVRQFHIDQLGMPVTLLVSPEGRILATTEWMTKERLLATLEKYLEADAGTP